MDIPTAHILAHATRAPHEPVSYRLCTGDHGSETVPAWSGLATMLTKWLKRPYGWERAEVTLANGQRVIVRALPPSPVVPFLGRAA